MNNPNDVTRLKHLDSLAADVAIRVPTPTAADHDKFLRGDGQWALPTVEGGSGGSSGQIVLGTTVQTVNGGLWYTVEGGVPAIKMRYGNSIYSFTSSQSTSVEGSHIIYDSNNRIIAYLPESELVMLPYDQLENKLSGDDYSAVMDLIDAENAYAAENNLVLTDTLYFVAPDNLPANFAYINILLTFDSIGTPREIHINGEPGEFNVVDSDNFNFKLTEFGLVTTFFDA